MPKPSNSKMKTLVFVEMFKVLIFPKNDNKKWAIKSVQTRTNFDIIMLPNKRSHINHSEVLHMNNYSILGSNLKRKILRFSEKISTDLSRPVFKFVSQIIYGMLSSQSCHLSKIARSLGENISLKKTIDRLSRHLSEFDVNDDLLKSYVNKNLNSFTGRTVLIIDGSDITKPCSPKMECISRVRDGSTGEYGEGYHTLGVTALTPEKKMPVSVYTKVYSASEKGFISENDEVLKALEFLSEHFEKSNIRAFDRGYDSNLYYEYLIKHKEKFIIRSKKNRDVIHNGERVNIMDLAKRFKGKYVLKFRKKNAVAVDCKISVVPIVLPCRPYDNLNLIICRGLGMNPLLLITNLKSDDNRLAVAVSKVYLMRWRIEEFYRFKKQQFNFEDFRVRSLKSIRALDLLLTIAIGYIGLISEKYDERLIVMEIINISKRIYNIPKFVFYSIADGLHTIFTRCKQGLVDMLHKKPKPLQLSFFTDLSFCCF